MSDLVWSYASRMEDGKLACSFCTTFVTATKSKTCACTWRVCMNSRLVTCAMCESCYVIKKTQQTLDKHKLAFRSKMAKDCMAHTCFCQMLLLHMLPEQKITSSPAPSATISHTKNTTWGSTLKLMNCHPRLTNVLLAMCWSTPGSFSGNTNLYVGSTTRCKTCNVSNKLSFSAITLLGSFGRHCGRVRGADGGKQVPM